MPYRDLFRANEPYECLEIDQPRNQAKNNIDYLYDGHVFPVADHHYGVVFSSQTLEHSFWPEEMLGEVYRVLRPGGLLVLAVPFFWPEHEQPYDSQRFTSFGLVARLEVAGFALLSVTKTNPGLSALIQLLMESIERPLRILSTSRMRALPKSLVMQFFRLLLAPPYAILNFLGSALRWGFRNKDSAELYLDLVIVAEKPEAL
jgi:SAM-dependent methyltransferase